MCSLNYPSRRSILLSYRRLNLSKMANFLHKVFLSTYAVMKDFVVDKSQNEKGKTVDLFRKFLGLMLAVALLLATALVIVPCIIFRTFLYILLKLVYGRSFGGFLNGLDTIFEINNESTVITAVMIYRFNGSRDKHIQFLQTCVNTMHKSMYKFGSSIGRLCGYLYFIKDRIKPEDVLKIIEENEETEDDYITKDMLYDYLEGNCSRIEKNQMWKVSGFLRPIRWYEEDRDGVKRYPIVFTIKHSMGDGPSIIGMLKRFLVKNMNESETLTVNLKTSKKSKITLDNVYVHRNPLISKLEGDILKLDNSLKWHLATRTEAKRTYLSTIKEIKDKLNVRFMDVINAAACSSVLDYIDQRNVKSCNLTATSIVRVHSDDLPEIISGNYNFNNLANNSSVLAFNVPFSSTEWSMKAKILSIHNTNQSLTGGMDFFLTYGFLLMVCTCIPIWSVKFFCEKLFEGATVLISNLVGIQRSLCMGCEIDDAFFCVPNFLEIGFLFTVFSYDGKLQLGVTSKRGYVHNREELQQILDNVFKYIDQAAKEVLYPAVAKTNGYV